MCEALRELFADDLEQSRNEGKMQNKIELAIKKYKKGCSIEQTADMLEESPALIRQIYELIAEYAPDENVECIYQGLIKKSEAQERNLTGRSKLSVRFFFCPKEI